MSLVSQTAASLSKWLLSLVWRVSKRARFSSFIVVCAFFLSGLLTSGKSYSAPNLEGVTGILNTPSAESLEDGEATIGFGVNNNRDRFLGARQRNYFFGVGYLPGLEICARYIDFPELQEQAVPGFGTRKDRSVNVKYQFVCESCHKISLAVGAYDVGGKARIERAQYLVGTKTFGPVKVSLGTGSKRLSGVFGGAEVKLSDKFTLLYENDRFDNNFGIRINPSDNLCILLGRVNEDFSVGISYTRDLVPPRGAEKPVSPRLVPSPISESSEAENLGEISSRLTRLGFENVEVKSGDGELSVKYENRLSRFEEEAWANILLWCAVYAPKDISKFRIVSEREGEHILVTNVTRSDIVDFVNGDIDAKEFAERISIYDYKSYGYEYANSTPVKNPSSLTTDIFFSPSNRLQLGQPFEPLKHRSGFTVRHETPLAKGVVLSGMLEVPLVNNLDNRDAPFMRREVLSLYKARQGGLYGLLSAGYYGEHIYGAKAELRQYFANSIFDVGVEGGYARDKFADTNLKELLFSTAWRNPGYDLSVRAYTGKFLFGDEGWMLETKRFFGRSEFAFFVYNTDATSTEAGFRFSVPLLGYSDDDYSRIRIGVAPFFNYEYRTTGFRGGDFLDARDSIEEFRRRLYPWYLREHLDILRKVARE